MNAIVVENLRKTYITSYWERIIPPKRRIIKTEALKGISFRVKEGEIFALLGPNGAGKTTTLNILAGLLLPDSGKAVVNGFDVVSERREVQKSVGFVTGGNPRQFYNKLTGIENLIYFATLYGIQQKRAIERAKYLLNVVGLSEKSDVLFEDYSTGMMQKLAIVRALIHDPPVILLDEPTLGLDPQAAHDVRRFIREKLKGEMKKTIILTTHYMFEAEELADRVAIIDNGEIIAIGKPEELKKQVSEESVEVVIQNLFTNPRDLLKNVDGIRNVYAEPINPIIGSWRVKLLLENVEAGDLLGFLIRKNGFKIKSFKVVEPTLEEVFLKLTARKVGG